MKTITRDLFEKDPKKYILVRGNAQGAPKCPFGNNYMWIGYDLEDKIFVRFTKSVFKKLIVLETKTNDE